MTGPTPFERIVDRVVTRRFRLVSPTSGYRVRESVRVPMRDGLDLVADHWVPDQVRGPLLLMRTPYARRGVAAQVLQGAFAARGYPMLVQSCRGTFGSEGEFEPALHEREDGADTLAWLRTQTWFDGRVVVVGGSYTGFTGWQVLAEQPTEVVGAILLVAVHDFHRAMHGTGAFAVGDLAGWADAIAHQESVHGLRAVLRTLTATRRLAPVLGAVPTLESVERMLGAGAPWFREWAMTADPAAPFWGERSASDAVTRVDVPVFLATGWQDIFLDQALEQFAAAVHRDVGVTLVAGPWTHGGMLVQGGPVLVPAMLDWLEHLDHPAAVPGPVVRYFVTGADEWRTSDRVVCGDTPLALAPTSGRVLAPAAEISDEGTLDLTFDPADPTPTIGGRLLSLDAGRRKDTSLGDRADVCSFLTEPFTRPVEVAGTPVCVLHFDLLDGFGDILIRLDEVDTRGRSRLLTEGYRRADGLASPLNIRLDHLAHRLEPGMRLRLLIAGGSHPRYGRNLGAGAANLTTANMPVSRIRLLLGRGCTALTLPVLGEDAAPPRHAHG